MRALRRPVVIALTVGLVIALVAGLTIAELTSRRVAAHGGGIELTSQPLAIPTHPFEIPGDFACKGPTCILVTTAAHGSSAVWASDDGGATFARGAPAPGPVGASVQCVTTSECLAIGATSTKSFGPGTVLAIDAAASRYVPLKVAPSYAPSALQCTEGGTCVTSGYRNGRPVAYVLTGQAWAPVALPSLPPNSVEIVDCATAALCIDQVSVPSGPTSDEGAYLGGLAAGFRTVLAPPRTPGQADVACSASACWLASDPVPSGGGITLMGVSASGTTRRTLPSPASGFLSELTCTPTTCLALERYGLDHNQVALYTLGTATTPIALPPGLASDDPVLMCTIGSSECLAVLDNREVVRVTPSGGRLVLDARVTLGGQGLEPPAPSTLVTCNASLCHEAFETTSAVALATLTPGGARPSSLMTLSDPHAGLAVLVPMALDCPSATSCDLVAKLGAGPSVLMEANLVRRRVTVVSLPQDASVEGLACASTTRCVLALSGGSQRTEFPTLALEGDRVPASALIGAGEELSSPAVACTTGGDCVAIATRVISAGDGSARPVVATSSDGGITWRLAVLRGPHLPAVGEPGVSAVSCTRARCVGIWLGGTGTTYTISGALGSDAWFVRPLRTPQPFIPYGASIGCGPRACLAHIGYSLPNADMRGIDLPLSLSGVPGAPPTKNAVEFASVAATSEAGTFLEATPTHSAWIKLQAR